MSDELWRWDAGKLNDAIRTRAVSCKEVVTSCLARVEAVNPAINAIVEKCVDEAIATAENADRELARGEPVKPLHQRAAVHSSAETGARAQCRRHRGAAARRLDDRGEGTSPSARVSQYTL